MTLRCALPALLALSLVGPAAAQDSGGANDGLQREGSGAKRAAKDALEGKAPPKLHVADWLNTKDRKPLTWQELRGKVVVLDFWGVW